MPNKEVMLQSEGCRHKWEGKHTVQVRKEVGCHKINRSRCWLNPFLSKLPMTQRRAKRLFVIAVQKERDSSFLITFKIFFFLVHWMEVYLSTLCLCWKATTGYLYYCILPLWHSWWFAIQKHISYNKIQFHWAAICHTWTTTEINMSDCRRIISSFKIPQSVNMSF